MENLEEIVKERNRAYYELEVGITGKYRINSAILTEKYKIKLKKTKLSMHLYIWIGLPFLSTATIFGLAWRRAVSWTPGTAVVCFLRCFNTVDGYKLHLFQGTMIRWFDGLGRV